MLLGERVQAPLRVRCVPTMEVSAAMASELGVSLTSFEEVDAIFLPQTEMIGGECQNRMVRL